MRGSFCRRGDKWSYAISDGIDPATGKRKRITKGGFGTKHEAQHDAAMLIKRLDYEKNAKEGNYFKEVGE